MLPCWFLLSLAECCRRFFGLTGDTKALLIMVAGVFFVFGLMFGVFFTWWFFV